MSSSAFAKALKPTLVFLGLFLILSYIFGDKSPAIAMVFGAPWSFLFTSYSESTLVFPFDLGAWINVVVIYALSAWFHSRKVSFNIHTKTPRP